ncbi:MAG: NAD-binding protein [Deltaproteobacteria bacterium]|nr:NAD-binding protein [Deltaproteobacteria bacterium]
MRLCEEIWHELKRGHFFIILIFLIATIILSSTSLFMLESKQPDSTIRSFWDALWWAVVSLTTVGYGDTIPKSGPGRLAGMITIVVGIGLISLLTATISSVFVGRRIMEDRGLESVHTRDHIVICGWNQHGEEVIQGLIREVSKAELKIVLVNELSMEDINNIKAQFPNVQIRFVHGDFTREGILRNANIEAAQTAIILADCSSIRGAEKADERTVLGTLTIKSMAPKVRTCAELLDIENRTHLQRINVDEVIVRGENNGAMLAGASLSPGISRLMNMLVSYREGEKLWKAPIPKRFLGRTFAEIFDYFRKEHRAMAIAVITDEKAFNLNDILSNDLSAIDRFIKKKFEEAEKELLPEKDEAKVILNPQEDYVLKENDSVAVIAQSKPA